MKAITPIALLNEKLAELKSIPGVEPHLLTEYEKAILVLELIGSNALDDKAPDANVKNNMDSTPDEPQKGSSSYFENFMKAQKRKKS